VTLGPEQRALLQLLLERDQSYDDIAAVLGAGREEARSRARSALAALAGREPDAELTDYLLGQAGPVERADVARRLRRDPESLELSARLLDELRALAPRARLPALPQPADLRSRADTGARARAGAEEGTEGLERRQRRMLLGLAAVAVLVFAVVGAVAGLFGGGDEPAPGPTAGSEEPEDAVAVRLEPRGRTDVGGRAVLGLATGDQPFIDLTLEGLEPIPPDDA
jgi:Sigma-70, region 4